MHKGFIFCRVFLCAFVLKGDFMNTKDFIAIEEEYGAHNYHPLDVVIERAEGVWVYDVDGKKYLDCLSA